MDKSDSIFILFILLTIVGCSRIAETYRVDPVINRVPKKGGYYINDGDTIDATNKEFKDRIRDIKNQEQRNDLMNEIISLSNNSCELHKAKIIANSNTWNIASGSLTSILSGLGTVVGGETTKAALSAGSAFSNSMRSLVNEEVYVESLATTIVRAIEIKRADKRTIIESRMKDLNISKYSIMDGLRDIEEYHQSCSFIVGILEVSKALENRKKNEGELINKIKLLRDEIKKNKELVADYDSKIIMNKIEQLELELSNAPK